MNARIEDDAVFSVLSLLSGAELMAMSEKVEWLVEGILPRGAITVLVGRGGIGKTWLALALAHAVSTGTPFLGRRTIRSPVCYADYENSLANLRERVAMIGATAVGFLHPHRERLPMLDDGDAVALYTALPPGLLIIDTLRAAHMGSEESSQHMTRIMTVFKEIRNSGHSLLVLHHSQKSDQTVFRGSSTISDLCDNIILLHETEEPGKLFFGTGPKTRYQPFSTHVKFDFSGGKFRVTEPHRTPLGGTPPGHWSPRVL